MQTKESRTVIRSSTSLRRTYAIVISDQSEIYELHAENIANLKLTPIQFKTEEEIEKLFKLHDIQDYTTLIIDISCFDNYKKPFTILKKLLQKFPNEFQSRAKIVTIIPTLKFAELKSYQVIVEKYTKLNSRILILDGIFGTKYLDSNLYKNLPVQNSSKNTSTKYQSSLNLVHIKDYLQALSKSFLNPNTQNKRFLITGKDAINEELLANYLTKLNTKHKTQKSINNYFNIMNPVEIKKTNQYLNYQPKISFTKYISDLSPVKNTKPKNTSKNTQINNYLFLTRLRNFRSTHRQFLISWRIFTKILKALLFTVILTIVSFTIIISVSIWQLSTAIQNLEKGQVATASYKSQQAHKNFRLIRQFSHKLPYLFTKQITAQIDNYLELLEKASSLTTQATIVIHDANFLSLHQKPTETDTEKIKQSLHELDQQIASFQTKLPNIQPKILKLFIAEAEFNKYIKAIRVSREVLPVLTQTIDQLPWLLGYDSPKEIVALLQNTNELRPTGGFIGSFAHITVSRGVINTWKIYDVYDADGQLQGYIKPPDPIKNVLNEPSWYLRDSNWDPDFPLTAQNAIWFLKKELNINPDIVVAVNLPYIEKLIEPIVPMTLSGVEKPVSVETLHSLLQENIESNFFPGSTNKKLLLTDLATQIISRYGRNDSDLLTSAMSTTIDSLNSRDIQIYSQNSSFQSFIDQFNWGGRLIPLNRNSISSIIAIVEANLGVNKTNRYINRQIKLDITDQGNTQSIALEIEYFNSAEQESKEQGKYQNYLRIYLPKDSLVNQLSITDNQNKIAKAVEPEVIYHDNFLELGFLAPVELKHALVVKLNFNTSSLSSNPSALLLRKQSGTLSDTLILNINSPRNISISSPFDNNKVSTLTSPPRFPYNTDLSTDKLIIFN